MMTSQALSRRMQGTSDVQRARLQLVAAEFVERLGARMRERREALDLSMAEVARRMPGKVSENQVYRWELGKHQPKPDTLEALAKVLETSVAALMAPAPTADETPDLSDGVSVEDRLTAIEDALKRLQFEITARAMEAQQQLEAGVQTILDSLPGQQP